MAKPINMEWLVVVIMVSMNPVFSTAHLTRLLYQSTVANCRLNGLVGHPFFWVIGAPCRRCFCPFTRDSGVISVVALPLDIAISLCRLNRSLTATHLAPIPLSLVMVVFELGRSSALCAIPNHVASRARSMASAIAYAYSAACSTGLPRAVP